MYRRPLLKAGNVHVPGAKKSCFLLLIFQPFFEKSNFSKVPSSESDIK